MGTAGERLIALAVAMGYRREDDGGVIVLSRDESPVVLRIKTKNDLPALRHELLQMVFRAAEEGERE